MPLPEARLRTLVVSPDYPPAKGGIQLLVERVCTLAGRLDVRLVTLGEDGDAAFDRARSLDVRRVSIPLRSRRLQVASLNFCALAQALRFRPARIVSAHVVTWPAARAAGRLLQAPVAVYAHADEFRSRPGLARWAMRRADAVIAVSEYARELALDAGAPEQNVHVVPNGVDSAGSVEASFEAPPTMVTVASLDFRYKGHDVLVRAMSLIRARVPEARWIVVGDGSLREDLQALVAAYGLEEAVSFVGGVTDRERDRLLAGAWVFAMPTRLPASGSGGEGFGIAYLEAASHGVPAVAGDAGGARDAVVHGETGLLVDAADHLAVAEGVLELLENPARAAEMGRAARSRARELSWERCASGLEHALLAL